MILSRRAFVASSLALGLSACTRSEAQVAPRVGKLIAAARRQIGITTTYDPAYSVLSFPNGDVPRHKGVCTDVVIRAYRDAFGIDLQALVNADMKRAFKAYPKRWGLRAADKNIDHRRVPNLQTFFGRAGAKKGLMAAGTDWQPGDIFTCIVNGSLPHIGIVSDRRTLGGNPLVIHNIGAGTQEEDALFAYRVTGRYRFRLDA